MAVEITRTVTSDLSKAKGAVRKQYTLDGTRYAIDVTEQEWNDFLASEAVAQFVMFSRTLSSKGDGNDENDEHESPKTEAQEIREWAQANGIDVSERGRVAKDVVERYKAAQAQNA